jgi:hypothetical protein
VAYAKPGKGLLKLNGETRISKQGSEQQHNGVCSSKRACRDWQQHSSAISSFRVCTAPPQQLLVKMEAQVLHIVYMINTRRCCVLQQVHSLHSRCAHRVLFAHNARDGV